MKSLHIPIITVWRLAAIPVLPMMSWAGTAKAAASLDKQLIEAPGRGKLTLVNALLDKYADVNAQTGYGRTPLMQAAQADRLEMLKLLIDKGADVHRRAKRLARP